MGALHCLLSASTPERLQCPRPSTGIVSPYPVLISRVGCRSWARSSWVLASCCMRRKWRAAPILSTVIMAGWVSSRVVTCGKTSNWCRDRKCTWVRGGGGSRTWSLLSTDPHQASTQFIPTPQELPKPARKLGTQMALLVHRQ